MKTLRNLEDFFVLLRWGEGKTEGASGVLAQHSWLVLAVLVLFLNSLDLQLADEGQNARDVLLNVGETVGGSWSAAALGLLDAEGEVFLSEDKKFSLKVIHAKIGKILTCELFLYCVSTQFDALSK